MAELIVLPQATYRDSSPQGRRRRALNTIIEEENEDVISPIRSPFLRRKMAHGKTQERDRVQAWLAPLDPVLKDDNLTPRGFPTPRGFHFMSAPTLPSSPSGVSGDEGSSSPDSSSNPTNSWHRQSVMTDATEFDDIYDVSSEDDDEPIIERMRPERQNAPRVPPKINHTEARRALPPLVIPGGRTVNGSRWSSPKSQALKKSLASPIPPTPPSAVAMSPAMLSFMNSQYAQAIPTISAPPSLDGSLDGSLTSEQLAAMSAPPTPVIGGVDPQDSGDWSGVHLQPGAMATLHALSHNDHEDEFQHAQEQVLEVPQEPMSESRPQPPRLITNNLPKASTMLSPAQQRSLAGLTTLDIPSPGGFFSGLSPRTRTTWHMEASPVDDMPPPTSTTAEQFYRTPWSMGAAPPMPPPPPPPPVDRPLYMRTGHFSSSPVEQVVEMLATIKEEDVPTARRIEQEPITAKRVPLTKSTASDSGDEAHSPKSPRFEEVVPAEIVIDYDPEYAHKQQEVALSHFGRTELWLMAQTAYLKGVGFESAEAVEEAETEAEKKVEIKNKIDETEVEERAPAPPPKEPEMQLAARPNLKKTVRFSEQLITKAAEIPRSLPSKLLRQESAYYRAFQAYVVRSMSTDVFVHRTPRFEALQAQRVSLHEAHRNQLLGKYQLSVVPQSAKKRMSANVARGDDVILDDPDKLKADKEAGALSQMHAANWHVAATKMLNGGRLIAAPVHKRLARKSFAPGVRNRIRILDLGGQAACDWAWHAAHSYPNAKVYTVTTKAIRQLSNSNIRGPPNHRQVAVENLCKLPFADNQFDLISARELHSILKARGEHGSDEWETCLAECMRVLKPGGYLEFAVMDSDIVNAGPLGLAKSVEFGFTLKTLGYDPTPTRTFVNRLSRAGFEDTRRAWLVLPVGPKPAAKPQPIRYGPHGVIGNTVRMDAMVTGSTEAIAAVTGLAAGWSWERWILRCEMEKAAGDMRLADTVTTGEAMLEAGKSIEGVHAIVGEGRACGAGYRMLRGYARKPDCGTLDFVLDFDSLVG